MIQHPIPPPAHRFLKISKITLIINNMHVHTHMHTNTHTHTHTHTRALIHTHLQITQTHTHWHKCTLIIEMHHQHPSVCVPSFNTKTWQGPLVTNYCLYLYFMLIISVSGSDGFGAVLQPPQSGVPPEYVQ